MAIMAASISYLPFRRPVSSRRSTGTTSLKFVPGFYAGPRGWCLKASPARARTGAHAPVLVDRSLRPNGPGDPSPGLRPEADALGKGAPPALRPERRGRGGAVLTTRQK